MKAFFLSLFSLTIFFFLSCNKEELGTLPTVITIAPIDITETTIQIGGIIICKGALNITEMGACWDSEGHPGLSDSKIATVPSLTAGDTIKFNGLITGLTTKTTYYVRAYAINAAGTAFGECLKVCTCK
jgi:hypothetical protein